MTKSNLQEEQFCSRCNAWGLSDMMLPLYRVSGPQGEPSLWMHHQCVEICSNTQFQAAMKRFETQVHSMADFTGRQVPWQHCGDESTCESCGSCR